MSYKLCASAATNINALQKSIALSRSSCHRVAFLRSGNGKASNLSLRLPRGSVRSVASSTVARFPEDVWSCLLFARPCVDITTINKKKEAPVRRVLATSAAAYEENHRGRLVWRVTRKVVKFFWSTYRWFKAAIRFQQLLIGWTPVLAAGVPLHILRRFGLMPQAAIEVWWKIVYWGINRSGPAFIKFVQWASTRRDIFPEDVCRRLSTFHGATKSHKWSETASTLDTAFGPRWKNELVLDDHEPVGSGCVAQVYKGTLKSATGEVAVAVKVLHPKVRDQITRDIDIARGIAAFLELLPRASWLSIRESVEEFAALMNGQLDMRTEAANLWKFQANFSDDPHVIFPTPLAGWIAQNALCETYELGQPMGEYLDKHNGNSKLAKIGLKTFFNMLFMHNFVHGDLHPGNISVRDSNNIVIYDAGIVVELNPQDRRNFLELFRAVAMQDGKRAGELMIERSRKHSCSNPAAFEAEMEKLVNGALSKGLKLSNIQVGTLLARVLSLCGRYQVKLESNFVRVIIAIAVLEGVGRSLDPDINLLRVALPVIIKAGYQYGLPPPSV